MLQTIGMSEREAALFTDKMLISSVCELVDLEILSYSARIGALLTPERLLS